MWIKELNYGTGDISLMFAPNHNMNVCWLFVNHTFSIKFEAQYLDCYCWKYIWKFCLQMNFVLAFECHAIQLKIIT